VAVRTDPPTGSAYPFWGREAEEFSPQEAVERFVPNRVWDEVRDPENRLLLGGVGTGKSIVLKRLSWPAMTREPAFLPHRGFFGLYVDVRPLDCLDPLFDSVPSPDKKPALPPLATRLVEYAAGLLLIQSVLATLADTRPSSPTLYLDVNHVRLAVLDALGHLLPSPTPELSWTSSPEPLLQRELSRIRLMISQNSYDNDATFLLTTPTLLATAHAITATVRSSLPRNWKVLLLIDQYESIHPTARYLLNVLLRRVNKASFTTIIASRPFAFYPHSPSGDLIPTEDFLVSLVEYLPHDRTERQRYLDLLRDIVEKLLPQAPSISIKRLLPVRPPLSSQQRDDCRQILRLSHDEGQLLDTYFGFANIAALSSGSIRAFFSICRECILALTSDDPPWHQGIPPAAQIRGVARSSQSELARVRALSCQPKGSILAAARLIADKTRRSTAESSAVHIPERIRFVADDLFSLDPQDSQSELLTRAFQDSVFQFCFPTDAGFLLPQQWRLQALLSPALKLSPHAKGTVDLGRGDFSRLTSQFTPPTSAASLPPRELKRVFLSTSFKLSPDQITLLEETFADIDIEVTTGHVLGPGQIETILRRIREADLTLVDITQVRPNVVLEMGMSLAIHRPVVPILNKDIAEPAVDFAQHPILKYQGKVAYSWSAKDMTWAREAILDYWRQHREPYELLDRGMHSRTNLRVAQPRSRTVFLYFPSRRSPIWGRYMPAITSLVRNLDYTRALQTRNRFEGFQAAFCS